MMETLDRVELFSDLAASERQTLLDFFESRTVDSGRALFRSGDESNELFVLVDGAVRLEIDRSDAGTLEAGQVLGAVSLARIGSRECNAIAMAEVRTLVLSRTAYMRLREEHPAIALTLQESIVRWLATEVRGALERA